MKILVPFGESPTDQVVMAWLKKRNIDPKDVMSYQISRGFEDVPVIKLTMVFNEPDLVVS